MKKDLRVLLIGILGLTASFVIPSIFMQYWLGALLAFVFATGYAFYLIRWSAEETSSPKVTANVRTTLFVVLLLAAISLVSGYNKGAFQMNTLVQIRQTIDNGMITAEMNESLFEVFRTYHESKDDNKTLEQTFLAVLNDKFTGDQMMVLNELSKDEVHYYYTVDDPNKISLIGVTNNSWGKDKGFINYNSDAGRFQLRATITERGISYVREN